MRYEDATWYYHLRHRHVCNRQLLRNTVRQRCNKSAQFRHRVRGSSGSRPSPATFCEQSPHLPLEASPQLIRQLRHLPCLRARGLGACHNRHPVRSHLLGALDLAATDVAVPPSPSHLVDRDTPPPRPQLPRRAIRLPRALLQRDIRSIFSQNCLGLKTVTRRTELIAVLRRRGAFAACLQETWREGIEELQEDGWLFVGSAPAAQHGRGCRGVGIMLSPLAMAALDATYTDLGTRVVAVRLLDARGRGILLISGYAPVSTASDAEWDEYYDSLASATARGHTGDLHVIGTDGNASVGRGSLGGGGDGVHAGAVGPFGLDHINASG